MTQPKIITPPLGCQGKKTKILHQLISRFNLDGCNRLIEPFVGTGVVGFNAGIKDAIFSDINPHMIAFYNDLKSNKHTKVEIKTYLEDVSKQIKESKGKYYYQLRADFNKSYDSLKLLALNKTCFNAVVRYNKNGLFNVPFNANPNKLSADFITNLVERVEETRNLIQSNNWVFLCNDFETVISMAKPDDFIYCDPPYAGRNVQYYGSWSDKDEERLAVSLKKTGARFALSSWISDKDKVNENIEKLWKEYNTLEISKFYGVSGKAKGRQEIKEAMIVNYEI